MTPRDTGARRALHVVFVVSQLLPVALLLAYVIGALILSGAQVFPSQSAAYDAVVPYPVFPVPAWLLIAPAVVGLVAIVPLAIGATAMDAPRFESYLRFTLGAGVSALLFMWAFPSDSGWIPLDDGYVGWHWVALAISIVIVAIEGVMIAITGPRYDRLKKAGELPEGHV